MRRIIKILTTILFLGFGIGFYFKHQYIFDVISGRNYSPSNSMKQVINHVDLTNRSKIIFNATHPQLQSAYAFNKSCPKKEANNYILGCYYNDKIYIYDIKNEELNGVEEVTLVHELLHAVYERTSLSKKEYLKPLLLAEYKKATNQKLKDRMDYYDRNEPGAFYNELHSIIGTEFEEISPKLEKYYAKYIKNRKKVVAYNQKYNHVFQNLDKQRSSLKSEIITIKNNYQQKIDEYKKFNELLSAEITVFNRNVDQRVINYNQAISEKNRLLNDQYKSKQMYKELIDIKSKYDSLINKYNQNVEEFNKLNYDLDSTSPIKSEL